MQVEVVVQIEMLDQRVQLLQIQLVEVDLEDMDQDQCQQLKVVVQMALLTLVVEAVELLV